MQQFFPLNFFDEKKEEEKVCAPADNDNDQREERNLKKSALLFWTPNISYISNNVLCNIDLSNSRYTYVYISKYTYIQEEVETYPTLQSSSK